MKHTFTPGPWQVIEDDYSYAVFQPSPGIGRAYICREISQGKDDGLADATLIAAAPDILKELESAHKFMSVYLDKHRGSLGQNWEGAMAAGIELMETAIKKARGL